MARVPLGTILFTTCPKKKKKQQDVIQSFKSEETVVIGIDPVVMITKILNSFSVMMDTRTIREGGHTTGIVT